MARITIEVDDDAAVRLITQSLRENGHAVTVLNGNGAGAESRQVKRQDVVNNDEWAEVRALVEKYRQNPPRSETPQFEPGENPYREAWGVLSFLSDEDWNRIEKAIEAKRHEPDLGDADGAG